MIAIIDTIEQKLEAYYYNTVSETACLIITFPKMSVAVLNNMWVVINNLTMIILH